MIDRRTFLGVATVLFGNGPFAAEAQPVKRPRIGYLGNGSPIPGNAQTDAFRQGLSESGWIDGENATIEYRWAEGQPERLPMLFAELMKLKVDVIMLSGESAIRAAQKATSTIPVVFVVLTDPVALGFVKSLAHPGGNLTGMASQYEELITKQLELLKEAIPNLSRLALLHYAGNAPPVLSAVETAARNMGLTTRTFNVGAVGEFESAFKAARSERAGAIHVLPSPYFNAQRPRLVELAARYRLPAFYEFRNYVQDGGLMSYGPSINEMFARAASYVDRILKGAKPGELPIERPARLEFVINLKTASALGLTIPRSLLERADEVIQ